jgi:hypothetical protein
MTPTAGHERDSAPEHRGAETAGLSGTGDAVTLFRLNPLNDVRWDGFVTHHPRASAFHTRGWLQALHRTYGYRPIVFSTSPPDRELRDAMVFCEVRSWLTGRRLVSLPFSDHCEPLVDDHQLPAMCAALQEQRHWNRWRYIELRPQMMNLDSRSRFGRSERFCLHVLDLRGAGDNQLFGCFHKNAIQQNIRRAEREGLVCRTGTSEPLLRAFYELLLMTRQRHHLPPQPFVWFHNLAACLGPSLTVRLALRAGRPVAAIITIRHLETVVYKYGASDAAFHNLGGMQLLIWDTIREARAFGCSTLDLGRSSPEQTGLLTFKDRWNARRSELTYWRYPPDNLAPTWAVRSATRALRRLPAPLRTAAGRYLYRHVA